MFTPPVAFIHLAIVQGAVYDAVNAIKGGHDPYLTGLKAPTSASKGAAASTAAHHVLIGLVDQAPLTATLTAQVKTDIKARLDAEYASSLAEIPDGQAKAKGIEVGAAAAAAMLANRVGDGRFGAPGFPVLESGPRGMAPDTRGTIRTHGCATCDRSLCRARNIFTRQGRLALTSAQYATEFNEVKALGRVNQIYADGSSDLAGELVGRAPGSHAVRGHAAGGGLEGTDDHRTSAVPRHDQHVGGGQPDQLLGRKGPLGLLAPDDGDPARRHRRQRCDRRRYRLDLTSGCAAVRRRAIGRQLRLSAG